MSLHLICTGAMHAPHLSHMSLFQIHMYSNYKELHHCYEWSSQAHLFMPAKVMYKIFVPTLLCSDIASWQIECYQSSEMMHVRWTIFQLSCLPPLQKKTAVHSLGRVHQHAAFAYSLNIASLPSPSSECKEHSH